MELKLFPRENFDKSSISTMSQLINLAEGLLDKYDITIPKFIEFYDNLDLFIKRILTQVESYGLTKKQAIEFIKASLNSGTYGTFSIEENSIIEMNFNPYFKLFYPSIVTIKLNWLHEDIYSRV